MKLWDFLECFMLFGAGAMFTMIISGSIYALGATRIIIVMAGAAAYRHGGNYRLLRGAQTQRTGVPEGI